MEQSDNFESANKARSARRLDSQTAFEAAQLIKPLASRGVSDWQFSQVHREAAPPRSVRPRRHELLAAGGVDAGRELESGDDGDVHQCVGGDQRDGAQRSQRNHDIR
jgi:hypothetical protein